MPGWIHRLPLAGLCVCAALHSSAAFASDADRRAGDVLRYAMPAGVLIHELWIGDHEGMIQFGESWLATIAATEVLKRTTRVERPDKSNDLSFPSGHASHAFAAAAYMHRRHGFEQAWPWYAAATYVGWTRVQARRHRWADVAGSAALAGGSAWWLVSPQREQRLSVLPLIAPGQIAIQVSANW